MSGATPDLVEAARNVRNASMALRAYMNFQDKVASIAIDLAEQGDPTSLRLLCAMKDLQAQTGELCLEDLSEDLA